MYIRQLSGAEAVRDVWNAKNTFKYVVWHQPSSVHCASFRCFNAVGLAIKSTLHPECKKTCSRPILNWLEKRRLIKPKPIIVVALAVVLSSVVLGVLSRQAHDLRFIFIVMINGLFSLVQMTVIKLKYCLSCVVFQFSINIFYWNMSCVNVTAEMGMLISNFSQIRISDLKIRYKSRYRFLHRPTSAVDLLISYSCNVWCVGATARVVTGKGTD